MAPLSPWWAMIPPQNGIASGLPALSCQRFA
jgi:hypothetical protein